MPTFATPRPISATVNLVSGDLRISAGERTDTIVTVSPRDPSNEVDVKTASQARVEYSDGKLIVKAPKPLQIYFTRKVGTIDVVMELPAGSHLHGYTADGELRAEGELGDCSYETASGDISLDRAGKVHLTTLMGQITVDRARGDCHITGSGEIRIGEIDGAASIRNLNGDSWVGRVTGDISLNSAHGNISVDRPSHAVVARTAYGSVQVGEVARGTVVLQSASGSLEIGIRKGTAAWLDVKSSAGRVRNSLESTDSPDREGETAEVRARTHQGDIVIRRAGA